MSVIIDGKKLSQKIRNELKEEVMKKWINTTISTYLLIFIRDLTLWPASLMAYYLANGIPISGTETSLLNDTDPLLKALIALAVFAFTKDLPKVLSEIFGYNLQENETISGIMSQGVGIVKGLALAKVGSSFAKKQMGMNALSSGLGGVSAGLGGLSEAGLGQGEKAQAFNAKHPKLTRGAGMIAGVGANLSPAFSNINSTMGQGVSSSFGSSILSPISNSASLAGRDYVYASKHAPSGHDSSTNESGAHGNAPSKVTQNQELNNQNNNVFDQKFFDSILANSNFNDYIQGGNINLSSAVSNNTAFGYNEGYAANNPIVTEMANAVADRAGVSIDSQTISDISGAIDTQLGDTSIVHDINNCTPQELSTVMNNVYTYVVATKNQGNLTPVAGNNT